MLMSIASLFSTVASICQQGHTIVWWTDIKKNQFEYSVANVGKPEIALAGASMGVDRVLFYIRKHALFCLDWEREKNQPC